METKIKEVSISKETVDKKILQVKTMIMLTEESNKVKTNKVTPTNLKDKKIISIRDWKNCKDTQARLYEEQMDAFIDGGLDSWISGLRCKFLLEGDSPDTIEERLYLILELITNVYKISQATDPYNFFNDLAQVYNLNKSCKN